MIHFILPYFNFSHVIIPYFEPSSLQLTGMVGDGSIEGRQAIEGAVGSKAKSQSHNQGRNLKAKTFNAKNKSPKLGNLPKRKI